MTDDRLHVLRFHPAQEFFEAPHLLQGARPGFRPCRHDLREQQQNERGHEGGDPEGHLGQEEDRGEEEAGDDDTDRYQAPQRHRALLRFRRAALVKALRLQLVPDRIPDHLELLVELGAERIQWYTVAAANECALDANADGDARFTGEGRDAENAVEQTHFMRCEPVARFQTVQDVRRPAAEQAKHLFLLLFLDPQVSADCEVHERSGDVAHVHVVVEQGAGFSR